MELYKAIKQVFKDVGYESIKSERFIEILDGYMAFKNVPASKYVLLHLVERYGKTLYEQHESGKYSPIKIKKYQQDIVSKFGFDADLVRYVLDSISYGLGWTSQSPQYAASSESEHREGMGPAPEKPLKPYETFQVNGVSFTMILVEGGTFMMGATAEQKEYVFDHSLNHLLDNVLDKAKPAHQVTLDSFQIGQTQVTQELWQAVMGANPSSDKNDSYPVANVSWNECQDFIKKLNRLTGKKFRLPSEAEWEFAARGGNKSKGYVFAGSNDPYEVGWYDDFDHVERDEYGFRLFSLSLHRVCTKDPNELCIYDMSGNVWECCQDWYGEYSAVPCRNPQGPSKGSCRVARGGSYFSSIASNCLVSYRYRNDPEDRIGDLGLRLAL